MLHIEKLYHKFAKNINISQETIKVTPLCIIEKVKVNQLSEQKFVPSIFKTVIL